MTNLVADVGGTNTRIALAENGVLIAQSLQNFRNDDYADFPSLLHAFRAADPTPVNAACLAVAGPPTHPRMRMTNRNWVLDSDELSTALNGAPVRFINDLNALARALPHLGDTDFTVLLENPPAPDGQRIVAGLGTGYNIATCLATNPPAFASAEHGHSYLSAPIVAMLTQRIGSKAANCIEAEDLFSGRGLSILDAALNDHTPRSPELIFEGLHTVETDNTLMLFATLFGLHMRDLGYAFMPLGGIYLAGTISRNLISAGYGPYLCTALQQPALRGPDLSAIPVSLINRDEAALIGCANTPPR